MIKKLKPKSGFSHLFHVGLNALLPAIIFVLVRLSFAPLAAALILLSKWRMFAVRPRYWPANIRANAVDLIIGFSTVIFMMNSNTASWQLVWAVAYGIWLIFVKPGSSVFKTSMQALLGQLAGLMAIFIAWGSAPLYVLVLLVWLVCYSAARHFFTSFEESYSSLYSYTWAFIGASLTWVLAHWLLFYGIIAQITLLLTVIGYSLAALYYLEQSDRLSVGVRRNIVVMSLAIVSIVLLLSDWGDKAI